MIIPALGGLNKEVHIPAHSTGIKWTKKQRVLLIHSPNKSLYEDFPA